MLPTVVGRPPSPKSPDTGILSDEDDRHRKVKDKKRQHSKKHHDKDKENRPLEPQGGWKVKETTQWQYPDDWRIADVCELQLLDDFINLKVPKVDFGILDILIGKWDMSHSTTKPTK